MKKILLMLCIFAFSSMAFAGDDNIPTPTQATTGHQAGFYSTVSAGWTKQDLNEDSDVDTDYKTFGGQWAFGYAFKINEKFLLGPELGWGYYGKTSEDVSFRNTEYTADLKSTGTDLLAVGQYYVTSKVDVIVKAGLFFGESRVTGDTSTIYYDYSFETDDETDTVPMAALGFGYDVTPKVNVNLTYYRVFGQDSDDSDFKVAKTNSVFAGLTYRF